MTFKEFRNKLIIICNNYVGTTNQNAYKELSQEIKDFINGNNDLWFVSADTTGYIDIDTEIGYKHLFSYRIIWKPDKRRRDSHGWTVKSIELEYEFPISQSWLDLDMHSILGIATFKLAEENYNRLQREKEGLLSKLKVNENACNKMLEVMGLERYDNMFEV